MPRQKQVIRDNDARRLAGIAADLREDYTDPAEDIWTKSPFGWIRTRSSRQRGKIGEQLIAGWCAARNLNVERSPDADADRLIEGHRVEIKFSTLWENGIFKFQQIRDQNYEFLICLGIAPFDARAWIFRKRDIPFRTLSHQHGGVRGSDTWWISVEPNRPPRWMNRGQRGRLRDVYRILAELRTSK